MATVFDVFSEQPFVYLEISRGEVYGNRIVAETELQGVVKIRSGMEQQQNIENRNSSSTIHAHPEDFDIPVADIVGNGVRVNDIEYSITAVTEGRNFDTNLVEHLTFTLERAEYA